MYGVPYKNDRDKITSWKKFSREKEQRKEKMGKMTSLI